MSKVDFNFLALCHRIKDAGLEYENKNRGVKRLQIPSYTFRHDMREGFPILSIKKVPFKSVIGELIWFLRGDNDVEYLNQNRIPIWNKDAYNWYKKHDVPAGEEPMSMEEFEKGGIGSVGMNYSVMWRDFSGVDQIMRLLEDMKRDIMSSRLKVNAWNPAEIFNTALPPCHSEFQVIGVPLQDGEFGFELHWNQRSVDTFLGLPFNIASYGALGKILEAITGYPCLAIEGTLKCVHFYDNQYDAVVELMQRNPYMHEPVQLEISDRAKQVLGGSDDPYMFDNIQIEDFTIPNYEAQQAIKVEMLAPKEL